jgi:hypothetical protein
VAGHLALIGYEMDEGASAWTWLQFQVNDVHRLDAAKQILHPALLVSKHPIVNVDKLLGDVMRLFNAANDPDGNGFALPKPFQPLSDSLCSRPMSAAGIG